ncbi:MAG TPA: alpha/beta hydrolase family protein [Blastocatellia bacterium]|nr:alpha/beta hydrolase family protein [Blastocatellia bacterium]
MRRRDFLAQSSAVTAMMATHRLAPEVFMEDAEQSGGVQSRYRGPLADADLQGRQLDSLQFCLSSYERVTPSMSFAAKDGPAARRWQKQTRKKLVELLGGFPAERVALRPSILERKEFAGYTREKIIFQSRDNLAVFGYLLLPKDRPKQLPAIICLPGHGRGCDDIVGIAEDGRERETKSGYQHDFALQAVEHGYAAFAIEQLAFGCRRDAAARQHGAGQSSCQPAAGAALLLGQTMVGWRSWDVMRAIDYLGTRPEVDASRIATMGISGGGTISLFSAALDQRIKVAVVSGYFNTFRDSIVSLSHCIDNYVPGLLNYVEMYDLAGLVAPRGLFVESGTRDPIFPIAASRAAFKKAQAIYAVFGAPEMTGQEVFEGEHLFYGKGAFEFLKRQL